MLEISAVALGFQFLKLSLSLLVSCCTKKCELWPFCYQVIIELPAHKLTEVKSLTLVHASS